MNQRLPLNILISLLGSLLLLAANAPTSTSTILHSILVPALREVTSVFLVSLVSAESVLLEIGIENTTTNTNTNSREDNRVFRFSPSHEMAV
jgi:hypothetical protein